MTVMAVPDVGNGKTINPDFSLRQHCFLLQINHDVHCYTELFDSSVSSISGDNVHKCFSLEYYKAPMFYFPSLQFSAPHRSFLPTKCQVLFLPLEKCPPLASSDVHTAASTLQQITLGYFSINE